MLQHEIAFASVQVRGARAYMYVLQVQISIMAAYNTGSSRSIKISDNIGGALSRRAKPFCAASKIFRRYLTEFVLADVAVSRCHRLFGGWVTISSKNVIAAKSLRGRCDANSWKNDNNNNSNNDNSEGNLNSDRANNRHRNRNNWLILAAKR